eukprot:1187670-Prorocentrum_minimum.AAC.6
MREAIGSIWSIWSRHGGVMGACWALSRRRGSLGGWRGFPGGQLPLDLAHFFPQRVDGGRERGDLRSHIPSANQTIVFFHRDNRISDQEPAQPASRSLASPPFLC